MISYVNEQLFRQDSVHKDWSITGTGISLSNADLIAESIDLEETLCSENNVIFGSCNSSILKFTTTNVSTTYKDKDIVVSVVLDNDTQNPFTVGTYVVVEETLSADRTKKDIVAYDFLYKIVNTNVADWYNSLFPTSTSTVTLKQFRDSFFQNFGITQETTTLVNDTMVVEKTIDAQELAGIDILKGICEINGVMGRIDRTNTFRYVSLSTTSVYNVTSSMYHNYRYEDYTVQTIDVLQIRQDSSDIGVVVGTGTNNYVIENNFLVYGKSSTDLTTIATNILPVINNISFVPCELNIIYGNPCVEVGDRITFTNADNLTFNTYVLHRVLHGLQGLRDDYDAKGDEIYPDNISGINVEIQQLKGRTNRLERTVDATVSELSNLEDSVDSRFTQTAAAISAKVDQVNGESTDSFSWEIVPTKFDIKCNGNSVLKVTSAGAEINGVVKATSGYIGSNTTDGLTIYSDGLRRGGGSGIGGDDGMYLGVDGFYVANSRNDKIQLEVSTGSGSSDMNPSILIERDKNASGFYLKDIQIGKDDCISIKDWEFDIERFIRREVNTTVISSSGISFKKNKVEGITIDNNKLSGNSLDFSREDNVAIDFRPNHANYHTTISYQTGGNEACVFATKGAVTSFMFVNGEDSITNHSSDRWQSLTPGLQIKNNKVAIGKLIANGTTPTDSLDVAGNTKLETLNSLPPNTYMGTIGSGSTILSKLTSNSIPAGNYLWQTQQADDSPTKGTVSTSMICKHTGNGTYSYVFHFNQNGVIRYASTGGTVPSSLTWTQIDARNATDSSKEPKVSYTTSGSWYYWKDSANRYHLHYRKSESINFNGSIGNLKYRTTTYDLSTPAGTSSVYSATCSTECSNDITGACIHSISGASVKLWLWAAGSGTKTVVIDVDIIRA